MISFNDLFESRHKWIVKANLLQLQIYFEAFDREADNIVLMVQWSKEIMERWIYQA